MRKLDVIIRPLWYSIYPHVSYGESSMCGTGVSRRFGLKLKGMIRKLFQIVIPIKARKNKNMTKIGISTTGGDLKVINSK